MKTYLYGDLYFILNFIMNLFLIIITAMLRQKRCRLCRFLLLSCINALITVACTYFLWEKAVLQMVAAILQMGFFVFWAYEREGIKSFAGDCLFFFFLTFFTGGFTGALQDFLLRITTRRKAFSVVWIFTAVFALFLLFFLLRWELIKQEHSRKSVRLAKVFHNGREVTVKVLYDTGNQLVSPYTGEGVAIISQKLAEEIGLENGQNPLLIPYHSIGGDGLLKAYRMDYMKVEGGVCKKKLLVAVSENVSEEQGVQMILNIT